MFFFGSRGGSFGVYDIENDVVLFSYQFESSGGITKIDIEEKEIVVGFVSGDVYIIDSEYLRDELESFLVTKEFAKTFPIFEKNVALMFKPCILQKLENGYEENKQKILALLAKHKTAEAYEVVKPFLRVKKISDEFDFFASQTADIVSFMDMIEKKDFTEAYKIAYKNEVIRKLYIFESLEREFKVRVDKALAMLEDSIANKPQAIELVKPFAKIPQKYQTIEQVFKHFDKFGASKELAKGRKFVEYFDMCEKYPFLKGTDMFKKVVSVGEGLLVKTQEFESEGMLDEALKYLNILVEFKPFELKAREKIGELNAKKEFLALCATFDGGEASALPIYRAVERYPSMQHLEEFERIHAAIKEKMDYFDKNITLSSPSELLEIFGDLVKMELLKGGFDELIKKSYLSQIRANAQSKDINWQKVFARFSESFSIDPQTQALMRELGVTGEFRSGQAKKYLYPKDILLYGREGAI